MLANQMLDSLQELSPLQLNLKPVLLPDLVDNLLANLPVLHQDSLKLLDPQQLPQDQAQALLLNSPHHKPDLFPSLSLIPISNPKPKLPHSLVLLQDLQVYLNNLELFKELPLLPMLVLALHLAPLPQGL